MMSEKRALANYPIHEFLAEPWSPYAFLDRPVRQADLRSLFEAARWAASSYNEQTKEEKIVRLEVYIDTDAMNTPLA